MVRGLVHEQDVGLADEHPRHRHPHLPATRERANVAVDPLIVEPEPVKDLACPIFERVAAEMFVLLLHLAEAAENLVHFAVAIRIGHRVLQVLELVMKRAEAAASRDGFVDDRAARHFFDVLAEVADDELFGNRNLAFVGGLLADDQAKQRRLAGSVGADEAHFLSRIELKGGVDEQDLAAVLLADA